MWNSKSRQQNDQSKDHFYNIHGNKTLIEDGVLARIDIYNSTVVTISLYEIVRGQTDNRSDITNGLTDHFPIPQENYQHYNYSHIILQISSYV